MQLLPLDNEDSITLTAKWLGDERNYRWLDFGGGLQQLNVPTLKVMARRDNHFLRIFTNGADHQSPIGIVGLSDVDRKFKTATLWIVLGEKQFSNKGCAMAAAAAILDAGFNEIGLNAINAWAVESNYPSVRSIVKMGFKPIGRQRQCHYIDGHPYDRLWFDILRGEYEQARKSTVG